MEEVKAKRFKKAIQAYQPGFQQDVLAYLDTVEQQGFTVQDIKDYHEYRVQELKQEEHEAIERIKINQPWLQCPECPALMLLYTVNTEPGDQTGDPKDKSMWMCQNQEECMHTIYNKESVEEIIKKE